MEGLVEERRHLVDIDDHRRAALATEEALEDPSQLALAERNNLRAVSESKYKHVMTSYCKERLINVSALLLVHLVEAQSFDASTESEQRCVDVARFLDSLANSLRLRVTFRSGQVAERQPVNSQLVT